MKNEAAIVVYASVLYWQQRELEFIPRCVQSLIAQNDDASIAIKVIVVDNGCGVAPRLPCDSNVELIRLASNIGFAAGHNVALRRAMQSGASYHFIFNSDAIAQPGCIRNMLAAAQTQPLAAFLGPVIMTANAEGRIESAGQTFNYWSARHQELAKGGSIGDVDGRPRQVDAVSGCALLARLAAVRTIGPLDEGLFVYFEDMDWCLRARRAGYEVLLVPTARVSHIGHGSTGGSSPLWTFYSVRNHLLVASRHARLRKPLLDPLVLAYHLAFLVRSRPANPYKHLAALITGAWAAWTGQLGACPANAYWR
ncbi:MAG: glycosyltransferase family 2 protein [Chloroflexi bacterium]|nr:glycosyltransferase family 2 protein [Chloroflexota bacterium]